ncbi:MAG TPA: geranylgeranylglycerol-phosphate geranylgeranyltransferase [Bacteroidia bacterium]|nr:geranylgeranylglycerol-phosphate geranylgeranyltransferase [Bacteroidia bacterium]
MKFKTVLGTILSVTRALNLLIVCITLLLIKYTIIDPILGFSGFKSSIPENLYLLLVLSTLFIAAGGYLINDYFDTGIDTINKPGKNMIGVTISKKTAIISYVFLNLLGLTGAFIFGHLTDTRYTILIFAISAGLLYFYSASYKKMFLVGNIIISLLTSLTIFLSILFDRQSLQSEPILTLVCAYAVFAFLISFAREIIKDCEDAQGDYVFNSNTLPLAIGLQISRKIASLITLILFISIAYIQIMQSQWENLFSFVYVTVFIQIPILILTVRINLSGTSQQDHTNSTIAKLIMVSGIFSMMVFYISSQ